MRRKNNKKLPTIHDTGRIEKTASIHDEIAKRIGYVDAMQMKRNEDEIDEQTKILFNWICDTKSIAKFF